MAPVDPSHTIEIVPIGGLANRMRSIASGLALARYSGRHCTVRWANNDELRADFSDLFVADSLPFELFPMSGMDKIVYSFRRFAGCGLSRLWQMHRFFPRVDDRRVVEFYRTHPGSLESDISHSGKDSLIISCLSFFPYEDTLYRSIFQFAPDVQERASEIVGSVTPDFGMHIRRTDNIKSISDSPLELFYEVTENLLSENESVKIFLATDSQTVKEDLSSRYPGTFIYNTSGASRDTRTGMIDAAAEMLILSRSRKIFGSFWSSFSEASACLGNIPLVICKTES